MGTGRKLLLADDSITIQKVVNLTFADEGLDVTAVGNGDLAIEKIEEIAPDIVLADIHMPGLNGYEVCEFVKRNERFRHIPVMLLVGSFEPFDEAEARRVGADDYLTKPFQSIRQLVSKVASLLSGKPAGDETPTKELDTRRDVQSEAEAQAGQSMPLATTMPPGSEMASDVASVSEVGGGAFADPSLDDAMIEATPVGDYNLDITIGGAQRATTPLSPADLEEAEASGGTSSPIHTQDTLQMRVGHESTESPAEAAAAVVRPARSARAISADDALLDLGDDEPQLVARGEGEFVLDILDDAPASPSNAAMDESPVVQYQGDVTEISAPAAEHVEPDIFETAPLVDVTSAQEPELEAVSVEPVADTREVTMPQTGMITLEQVSPEVIDAIARRAVEQLSEKVVEQIAWEVVPELAERLIKRRLEEERRQ